ncbi:MAG: hypothetical protein OES47_04570 [Acidobacteriota bacterium]|nr:hypothetical protein [Acidobacteriota bacterium]
MSLRPGIWAAFLFLLAGAVAAQGRPALHHQDHPKASPVLAQYDFEEPSPSGPDTFWVRQRYGGEVALSTAFRVSGVRSLHISEVPGNRDFAEFLAYFDERREGTVFIQFYLLLTDPEQRFNFGLAGPKWFLNLERHGHAIWLQTDQGFFRHRSQQGWQPLFAPRPFAWYFVDFVYHVDQGLYDLALFEEGQEDPVIDVRGVRNLNGHDRSSVKYFSLIGDLEDAGRFDFFVDDLIIATDPAVRQKPFVAPGRRRTFVDQFSVGPIRALTEQEVSDLLWKARRWRDEVGWEPETVDRDLLDRLESAADDAFRAGELDFAETVYLRLQNHPRRRTRALLKHADIRHLRGDVQEERRLREAIYGALEYEE